MQKVAILTGNIGGGKSTVAKALHKKGYVVISRDALRYMYGAGSYVFDRELELSVHVLTMTALEILLNTGRNIVIDETNVSAKSRKNYIEVIRKISPDAKILSIELPRISRKESLRRRLSDPHGTFGEDVWGSVWDTFDRRYESPTHEEGFHKVLRVHKEATKA